jgi:hypothetical protein
MWSGTCLTFILYDKLIKRPAKSHETIPLAGPCNERFGPRLFHQTTLICFRFRRSCRFEYSREKTFSFAKLQSKQLTNNAMIVKFPLISMQPPTMRSKHVRRVITPAPTLGACTFIWWLITKSQKLVGVDCTVRSSTMLHVYSRAETLFWKFQTNRGDF